MSASPLFSVVIPLYNKELSIVSTLKSVIAQTFSDFEVLVVDDGSRDGSWGAAQQVRDPRIILIWQENLGESGARNTGIDRAGGEFIVFLDADDQWKPGHLQMIYELTCEYPDAGIYATGYLEQRATQSIRRVYPMKWLSGGEGLLHDYFMAMVRAPLFILPSCCAVRAEVFVSVGFFELGQLLGADQDMWSRICLRYPVAYRRECTVVYRTGAENRACDIHRIEAELPFSRHLQSFLDEGAVPRDLERSVRLYIQYHLLNVARDLLLSHKFMACFRQLLDARIVNNPLGTILVMYYWVRYKLYGRLMIYEEVGGVT